MTKTQKQDRLEGLAIRMAATRQEQRQAGLPHAVFVALCDQLQEDEQEYSGLWQELNAPAPAKKARCEFYREIRRFYAIATEAGLNTKEFERMRGGFSAFLSRRIESRSELDGADWVKLGNAIKARRLTW
jgi:hypothetical protein